MSLVPLLAPWLAAAALAVWVASPGPWTLVLAATAVVAAALGPRGKRFAWHGGVAVLVLSVVLAFVGHHRVAGLLSDWDAYWTEREAEVGEVLAQRLERRQMAAEAAADALAEKAIDPTDPVDRAFLRDLRIRHGVSALALYDAEGRVNLWDGEHWGKVPESVQGGFLRHTYYDRPLFGYLYVTALTEDGRVAMAADLLRADLPEVIEAGVEDFSSRFFADLGERVRVSQYDPGVREGVWDLALPDRRLMSVVVERPSPEVRAGEVMALWRMRVAVLVLLAWGLLAVGCPGPRSVGVVGAGSLLLIAGLLPHGALAASGALLGGSEQLVAWVEGGLARWVLVSLALVSLLAVFPRPSVRLSAWSVALAVALVHALGLGWLAESLLPMLRGAGRLEWITVEVGVATVLTLVTLTLFTIADGSRTIAGGNRSSSWKAGASAALALVIGGCAGVWVWSSGDVPPWWWLLWGAPAWMAPAGLRAFHGWRRTLATGALAVALAGSATIPAIWSLGIRAEMALAEDRLEGLASREDPVLVDGLQRMALAADSLDAVGREGVDVLYHAWRASGLAGEGRPVRLTRWDPSGYRGVELRVGAEGNLPGVLPTLLAEQRETAEARLLRLDRDDARYVLTVPMSDGGVLSAVAPPFSERQRPSTLDPFVRAGARAPAEAMTFIQLLPGEGRAGGAEQPLRWVSDGWERRAELGVRFANDRAYHVHYTLSLPMPLQAVARATLLLVLNGVLVGAFWLLGAGLRHRDGGPAGRLRIAAISFQARVTWALFGFFALANGLFGTVAYRTVSQASVRSAEVIAERVVDDAAVWYRALAGGMDRLGRQVGADLVVYRSGELAEGSVEELVELGLYDAWTPYEVHEDIRQLEGLKRFTRTDLGRWEYVTAFRRLPDGDVMAAQVPLQAGTAAIQATDLLELLGFFVVLGAALSLGLAMLAGRALTRPIQALQVASERVGSGNLGLRLPEDRVDEFGAVFRAFNRMVARVRQARRELVRTSRRTQLIMDESAVGMLAVDASARITLVNPRASELLGAAVVPGEPLGADDPLAEDLGAWLREYLERGAERADHEFQAGDRRIRVRARRLGRRDSKRGAVVAMDDVTDELRAERVIAWGEMARQVAHEVKNPLTPIKLSVQHVRRAWEDDRPDFEEILFRNADAMLREIDRLATIAQSFSRFGAPADAGVPLEPVVLQHAIGDVMALYGGTVASVAFTHDVEADLPPVVARTPELKEVLVNLLENARFASAQGGTVEVRAKRSEEGGVVLEVTDEGAGIPDDVLPRIFEPQFSTRSTGSGLGLAIVRRLVASWGGEITVRSREGVGTTMRIHLRPWTGGGAGGV